MSIVFISEDAVRELLTMEDALRAVTSVMQDQAEDQAENLPRRRLGLNGSSLNMLAASWAARGVYGQKIYSVGPGGAQFWVMLFRSDGRPYAIVEAQRLGQIRTGAATGVASRAMAKADSRILGVIGSGYQMRAQVEAVCKALPISMVRVWSPNPERRQAFSELMSRQLDMSVVAVDTVEEATSEADVINVLTTAKAPVLFLDHLPADVHINAAGSNNIAQQEIAVEVVAATHRVVTDDVAQAQDESGDLIPAVLAGALEWSRVDRLADVIAQPRERLAGQSTLFKSHGIGLWDIAVALEVVERAIEAGRYESIEIGTGADRAAPLRFQGTGNF